MIRYAGVMEKRMAMRVVLPVRELKNGLPASALNPPIQIVLNDDAGAWYAVVSIPDNSTDQIQGVAL